jgi:hypothetical protein
MDLSKIIRVITPQRVMLEKAALLAVCACQYYDLADCMDATSDQELVDIVSQNYDCPMCGLKGSN